jgi:hypothetical protein
MVTQLSSSDMVALGKFSRTVWVAPLSAPPTRKKRAVAQIVLVLDQFIPRSNRSLTLRMKATVMKV